MSTRKLTDDEGAKVDIGSTVVQVRIEIDSTTVADEVVLGSTEITRSDSGEVDSGTVPDQSLEVDTG